MWKVEQLGLRSLFKETITSNCVEGINYVYKELNDWKIVTIDRLVLSLNFLQGYYINEVLRGYCSVGGYKLKSGYECLRMDLSMLLLLNTYHPGEVVQRIKELNIKVGVDDQSSNRLPPLTNVELSTIMFDTDSQVTFSDAGAFIVKHTNGNKYMVTLLDDGFFGCTCGLSAKKKKSDCMHVIAVKRKMNIKVQQPIPKPNCSSLRKREKVEAGIGRTGRKNPSVWDKENIGSTTQTKRKGRRKSTEAAITTQTTTSKRKQSATKATAQSQTRVSTAPSK
ncbi:unnamed protein product, partial [Didymodactylos carnosus]